MATAPRRRKCDGCGCMYEPKRATSRYHDAACGARARRRAAGQAETSAAASAPPTAGKTEQRVRAQLEEADRLDTIDGQCALALARSIDRGDEKGTALAAVVKALRETVALALVGVKAPGPGDQVDQLQARREERRSARLGSAG